MSTKVLSLDELAERTAELRQRGSKIVATNGCFDLIHVGHVRYLARAKELGDVLIVGVNGDSSVRSLKGAGRPLNRESDRAEVLAALEFVDFVVVFPDVRATQFLRQTRPAIYVKGGDYTPETLDAEERAALAEIGAETCIVPFEAGHSTSGLIARLQCE
ncbi:MAG: adenylyltransferase/cytidyltransferase family protein [Verrucomicrobiota bacterium]|nr:adenylyltransferase/cytidyltransferase family protein [Verrucomicrobiota bacterium]